MKLWLLRQDVNTKYDTYDSAVVAAETLEEARLIHPEGPQKPFYDPAYELSRRLKAWAPRSKVKVTLIGTAIDGTPTGVILASYNAG